MVWLATKISRCLIMHKIQQAIFNINSMSLYCINGKIGNEVHSFLLLSTWGIGMWEPMQFISLWYWAELTYQSPTWVKLSGYSRVGFRSDVSHRSLLLCNILGFTVSSLNCLITMLVLILSHEIILYNCVFLWWTILNDLKQITECVA